MPLKLRSSTVGGALALRLLASAKRLRRFGRFALEQTAIELARGARRRPARARAARAGDCPLRPAHQGYATNERGKRNLLHVVEQLARAPRPAAERAEAIRAAREALADEAGTALDRALVAHGAQARPLVRSRCASTGADPTCPPRASRRVLDDAAATAARRHEDECTISTHHRAPRLVAAALLLAGSAFAQQAQEEPFWARGRPKTDTAMRMAPVPAFPIATPADKLPIAKMKLPPGFRPRSGPATFRRARRLRQGDKGTVFVSSLFVAGKIYAVVDKGGKREVKTLAEKLFLPNGIEFHKGSLYVATPKDITRYDDIENRLDAPPAPVMVYDKLPGEVPHGWKFIRSGPTSSTCRSARRATSASRAAASPRSRA
jgi:hypothetical protein